MERNIGDSQQVFIVDLIADLQDTEISDKARFEKELSRVFFLERMRMTMLENQIFQDVFHTHQIFQKMRFIYWKIEQKLLTRSEGWILKTYDQACEDVLSEYGNIDKQIEIFIDNSLNVTRYKLEAMIASIKLSVKSNDKVMLKYMNLQHLSVLHQYIEYFIFEKEPDQYIKKFLRFYGKSYCLLEKINDIVSEASSFQMSKSTKTHEPFLIGLEIGFKSFTEAIKNFIDFIYVDLDLIYIHQSESIESIRTKIYLDINKYYPHKRIVIKMPDIHFLMTFHEIPNEYYFNDEVHLLKAYSLYQYEIYWVNKLIETKDIDFNWPNIIQNDVFQKLKESLPNLKAHKTGLVVHDMLTHEFVEAIKGFDHVLFNVESLMTSFQETNFKTFYKEQLQYLHYYVSRRRRKDVFNLEGLFGDSYIEFLIKRGVKQYVINLKALPSLETQIQNYLATRGRFAKKL